MKPYQHFSTIEIVDRIRRLTNLPEVRQGNGECIRIYITEFRHRHDKETYEERKQSLEERSEQQRYHVR